MRLTVPIFLLVALVLMLIGYTLYENGEIENIYNLTEETLVWNLSYNEIVIENVSDITSVNIGKAGRISNVIYKFADFLGYSAMEISKYFVEFGFNNPQYDYNFAITLIKYYFIFMLVAICIPLLIPLGLLLYLCFIGIRKIFRKLNKKQKEKR